MFSFEEGMYCCSKTSEEEKGGKGRGHVSQSIVEQPEHLAYILQEHNQIRGKD